MAKKAKPAQIANTDPIAAEVPKEDQMAEQEVKTEVETTNPLEAKLSEAEKKAQQAEALAQEAQTRADRALGTIRESFRSRELANALHPDILTLAPQLELDDDLQPTKESLEALRAWKADRTSLFAAPAPAPQTAPAAAPVPANLTTPAPTQKAVEELTQEEISRVFTEDRAKYMTPAFQKKVEDFYLKQRAKK